MHNAQTQYILTDFAWRILFIVKIPQMTVLLQSHSSEVDVKVLLNV